MKLPTFEGNGPQGQTRRATTVFEVQNIKGSTKVHPTFYNMEESETQGSRPSKKNPRTFLGKILQQFN